MHAANGLFVDKDVPTGKNYLETLARHYGTGVYPVAFRDEGATKPALDAWVDKNTGGRIKKAPAENDRDNTFSLLNALYFAAAWQSPFDPNDTSDGPFTKSGGEEISVPTMHNELELAYAEGAGWRAVELPYAEGFAMRLVLPGPGERPETLTVTELAEITSALDTAPEVSVQISLPKWDHKSSFELRKVFESLGLAKTLDTTEDFDGIQSRLTITQAAQAANITVAEKGTVAAAVTQINGAVTGAPPVPDQTIDFDRPFHYQIVHVETGLPLFMGTVSDPR
jgi:serpin B